MCDDTLTLPKRGIKKLLKSMKTTLSFVLKSETSNKKVFMKRTPTELLVMKTYLSTLTFFYLTPKCLEGKKLIWKKLGEFKTIFWLFVDPNVGHFAIDANMLAKEKTP